MSLPHLILGLLAEEPMTGYDLNKMFEQTAQHFWTTDQSQIYRALYRMEKEGWVYVENVIQLDNPNKKVYHVSEAGHAELRHWLTHPLPTPPVREGWLGQLYFGGQVNNTEIIAVLQTYLDQLRTQIEPVETLLANLAEQYDLTKAPRSEQFHLLLIEWAIKMQRVEIEQIRFLIDRIHQFPEKDDEQANKGGNHDTIS